MQAVAVLCKGFEIGLIESDVLKAEDIHSGVVMDLAHALGEVELEKSVASSADHVGQTVGDVSDLDRPPLDHSALAQAFPIQVKFIAVVDGILSGIHRSQPHERRAKHLAAVQVIEVDSFHRLICLAAVSRSWRC